MNIPFEKINLDTQFNTAFQGLTNEDRVCRLHFHSEFMRAIVNFVVAEGQTVPKDTTMIGLETIFDERMIERHATAPWGSVQGWTDTFFFLQGYARYLTAGNDIGIVFEGASISTTDGTFNNVALPAGARVHFIMDYYYDSGINPSV